MDYEVHAWEKAAEGHPERCQDCLSLSLASMLWDLAKPKGNAPESGKKHATRENLSGCPKDFWNAFQVDTRMIKYKKEIPRCIITKYSY